MVTAIRSEKDYRNAMARIDALLARVDDLNEEEDRILEAISILVADYEKRHFPIEDMTPPEYLRHHMQQFGRRQKDLADVLGSASLASHVINGHRALSLEAIRKISAAWNIPIALLAAPYELQKKRA